MFYLTIWVLLSLYQGITTQTITRHPINRHAPF